MKFFLEVAAVGTVGVLNNILAAYFWITNPNYTKTFSVSDKLLRQWLYAASVIVVVLLVASDQPSGLASIGLLFLGGAANILALLIGYFSMVFVLLGYTVIYNLARRLRGKGATPPTLDTSRPLTAETLSYRDKWERWATMSVLPFSVLSEDFVYRGFLVLLLGSKTGTYIPWAILSVLLSIMIHLYQGRNIRFILFHFLTASFLVSLTVLTHNVIATFAAHIVLDSIFFMQTWQIAAKLGISNPPPPRTAQAKAGYLAFISINIIIFFTALVSALL